MSRYPDFPGSNSTDTSQDAADSMEEAAPILQKIIWDHLVASHTQGMTCFELEEMLRMSHQTVSPRLSEMRTKGYIVDSGRRRPAPSGRKVIVWMIKSFFDKWFSDLPNTRALNHVAETPDPDDYE